MDEFTTIDFYSLQSGILDMSSSLYGHCYKLNMVNSSLIICNFFSECAVWGALQ